MRERLPEVDALKGIGILAVVLVHCTRALDPSASGFELWLGSVIRFNVPAFLVASGALYASTTAIPLRTVGHRLRRLIPPYLLASVAAEVFWISRGSSLQPGKIALDFALGSAFDIYYYVFVIACLVLVTPLFAGLPRKVFAFLTAVLVVSSWFAELGAIVSIPVFPREWLWLWRNPLLWWGYFCLGWWLGLYREKVVAWLIRWRFLAIAISGVIATTCAALIAANLGYLASGGVLWVRSVSWVEIYAILALLVSISCWWRTSPRTLRYLSDATYTVYLFHPFFVYTVQRYVASPPRHLEPQTLPVPWAAGVAGSLVIVAVARRLFGSYSRDIVGA